VAGCPATSPNTRDNRVEGGACVSACRHGKPLLRKAQKMQRVLRIGRQSGRRHIQQVGKVSGGIGDAPAHGRTALYQNDVGPLVGGRRNRLAANTVPLKPAPTMTRELRIVENSTQGVIHSFANIQQNSWSNSALNPAGTGLCDPVN
jgi:hypothetical protein